VKLRLHGTREEVAEATRRLLEVLEVVAVSPPYPDRGASVLVRVYLEVRLAPPEATGSTGAPPGGSSDASRPAGRRGRRPRGEVPER
jgi:hypothetical protein